MREFVAEQYLSAADAAAAGRDADKARRAAEQLCREGRQVRFKRSTFVPDDETCMYLYEADSVEAVRVAAERASLRFDRISEARPDSGTRRPASRERQPAAGVTRRSRHGSKRAVAIRSATRNELCDITNREEER